MNPVFTFVLGLLIGWLIEWLIDYFYWRRRYGQTEPAAAVEHASVRRASSVPPAKPQTPAKVVPDDLKVIKGIGTVIERKLNEAGVYTFEQLGNLTPASLRRILGNTIERLADEESLLRQARDLARQK
jgi:predicted flap endonuclease-1-like 5' DNA nuclease